MILTIEEIRLKVEWMNTRLAKVEGTMDKLKDDALERMVKIEIRMARVSLVIGILGVIGGAVALALVKTFIK